MKVMNTCWNLIVPMGVALLIAGPACTPTYEASDLEGDWECETAWTWDREGEPVPCSIVQRGSCVDARLSSREVVSIGDAQWHQTIEGTCHVSGQELVSTYGSVESVTKNDAAKKFEEERLEGRSLASLAEDHGPERRSRVVSLSETQLRTVNDEGRITTCTRL